ncbi:hypothetical protein TNCV_4891701 [Trichonephila clavipes]|nr:hypothetical protein TNCV_4891701 [Trichonephila clavipes]
MTSGNGINDRKMLFSPFASTLVRNGDIMGLPEAFQMSSEREKSNLHKLCTWALHQFPLSKVYEYSFFRAFELASGRRRMGKMNIRSSVWKP